MSDHYEPGTSQESFVEFLRRKADEAQKKAEEKKKAALKMEIDPIMKKCEQAAVKGEMEISVPRTECIAEGINTELIATSPLA